MAKTYDTISKASNTRQNEINVVTYIDPVTGKGGIPHVNQQKIIDSSARFKVINCGRRFGKTTFAINTLFLAALLQENGTYWYVAPTYRQAKQIAWRMLFQLYNKNSKKLFAKQPNESQLSMQLYNGSYIELKGADNEDSLRGVGLNGVVLDEYATMKPNVWEEIISPTVTDTRGWAIFISTPKGYNHFHKIYQDALKLDGWEAFSFTTYDNPRITKAEIDRTKETMSEDFFAQEHMADFRKFTGLVYKDFNRETHVCESFQIPSNWPLWRSIDHGFTNPFVCLWITQDPEGQEFYVFDEHYLAHQTTKYHAEIINGKSFGMYFRATYIDPAARQVLQDLGTFGIYCTQGNNTMGIRQTEKNSMGIGKITELLKIDPRTKKPRIFVFSHCKNIISEFEKYRWEETKLNSATKETPHKEDDHAMDALRYFVNSYYAIQVINKPYKKTTPVYTPLNSFTGY